jgi:hypothetical protein
MRTEASNMFAIRFIFDDGITLGASPKKRDTLDTSVWIITRYRRRIIEYRLSIRGVGAEGAYRRVGIAEAQSAERSHM